MTDRRQFLMAAAGGVLSSRLAWAQSPNVTIINAGTNVVAFSSSDGVILVDTGAMKTAFPTPVRTDFNTHYHLDNTGLNEARAQAGAKIIAHERTRQWMSTDYWVPGEDRFEKARPKAARPGEVFKTTGSLKAGGGAPGSKRRPSTWIDTRSGSRPMACFTA